MVMTWESIPGLGRFAHGGEGLVQIALGLVDEREADARIALGQLLAGRAHRLAGAARRLDDPLAHRVARLFRRFAHVIGRLAAAGSVRHGLAPWLPGT